MQRENDGEFLSISGGSSIFEHRLAMKQQEQPLGVWQYFMLIFSILSLVMLAAEVFLPWDAETKEAFYMVDNIVCAVFFADFLWQLYRTKPRIAYLKWGWLDLISSIPILPEFRVARMARVVRLIRVLRAARASRHMLKYVMYHRTRSTFAAVVLGSLVLVLFSAIAITSAEPHLTPDEAIWWCIFTLIAGEYGDYYPSSNEGRVITALLMTAGVAMFGTFTATVASYFMEEELEEEQREDARRDVETLEEIRKLSRELAELKQQLAEQRPESPPPQTES